LLFARAKVKVERRAFIPLLRQSHEELKAATAAKAAINVLSTATAALATLKKANLLRS
jgi:hypothetical protein